MAEAPPTAYADLLGHMLTQVRAETSRPFIIGIAGPPGTGKSTLAARLVDDLSARGLVARYCPMDGFHFANAQLDARKLRSVKGRIDTFDAEALLEAMERLEAKEAFWWPTYSRSLHEPVAHGVQITGREDVCLVEGNYLLSDAPVWRDVARLLDLRVFIDAPDELLRGRLLARHRTGGRNAEEANTKIASTDFPNAMAIRTSRSRADIVVDDARQL